MIPSSHFTRLEHLGGDGSKQNNCMNFGPFYQNPRVCVCVERRGAIGAATVKFLRSSKTCALGAHWANGLVSTVFACTAASRATKAANLVGACGGAAASGGGHCNCFASAWIVCVFRAPRANLTCGSGPTNWAQNYRKIIGTYGSHYCFFGNFMVKLYSNHGLMA